MIAAPLDGIVTRLLSDVRMHIEIARKCRLDRLDPAMPRETPIEIQIAVLRFLADEGYSVDADPCGGVVSWSVFARRRIA